MQLREVLSLRGVQVPVAGLRPRISPKALLTVVCDLPQCTRRGRFLREIESSVSRRFKDLPRRNEQFGEALLKRVRVETSCSKVAHA
jgi:hypothetical protein